MKLASYKGINSIGSSGEGRLDNLVNIICSKLLSLPVEIACPEAMHYSAFLLLLCDTCITRWGRNGMNVLPQQNPIASRLQGKDARDG